ncbi:hypothetical protein MUG87_16695 [Ectobacillus sp. JY-23]|uniref:hypothetical protein n=1 Tax=Ectobacillus sp. JY-23 TaxID=2933872 RepID=UPI001FF6AF14|nr:hypothetical protein [Ectobacillus sp. JY-23]UOY92057.1 hypothetical protein MUG87_16695 [Ectobacillus sp. JY-23]
MLILFALFACFILFYINVLTHHLCVRKAITPTRAIRLFRVINICVTILLISAYVRVFVAIHLI